MKVCKYHLITLNERSTQCISKKHHLYGIKNREFVSLLR